MNKKTNQLSNTTESKFVDYILEKVCSNPRSVYNWLINLDSIKDGIELLKDYDDRHNPFKKIMESESKGETVMFHSKDTIMPDSTGIQNDDVKNSLGKKTQIDKIDN